MEQTTTTTNMCDECHTVINGNLRTHKQNVHQTATSVKVTLDGQTITYKLKRQSDGNFHCPCGNATRPSAKNIATHCKACRAGFAVELARITALEEAAQAPMPVNEESLDGQEEASSTQESADSQPVEQEQEEEEEEEGLQQDTFVVDNQIGQFYRTFNSTLYQSFGLHIHIASGAVICQKCTAAVELGSVYSHLNNAEHGYIRGQIKGTTRNSLNSLLTANGAKHHEDMGLYYQPTMEKLEWIPMLEVYVGHVCKICHDEQRWIATKSWVSMGHHFTEQHKYVSKDGNTFTCEMQTIFGYNRARYFGIMNTQQQQQQQSQMSRSAEQQLASFFNRHPAANIITTLNHYGDDAEIIDHRSKLTNSFIDHFKLQAFFDEFNVIEGLSAMQLRKVLHLFVSRETPRVTPVYDAIRQTAHTFFGRINQAVNNSNVGYYWRRQAKSLKDAELTTRGLNALQQETLKRYVDIWANMLVMLARTIHRHSNEEQKYQFARFDVCRLMSDHQQECLEQLIQEAEGGNDERRMEMLLLALNLSIFARHMPSEDSSVDGITEKTPSLAFCNLYFLRFDGSFRNLRDVTKAHAIMIHCFRATALYDIFLREKIINLEIEDETAAAEQDDDSVDRTSDGVEEVHADLQHFDLEDPYATTAVEDEDEDEDEYDDFDMEAYRQVGAIATQIEERERDYQQRMRN